MACSADAIVFGNAKDPQSQVTKIREENKQRSFYVLEQLHVLPNVTYLAKVRNTDEVIESKHHEAKAEGTMPAATKPEEVH
jgi:molybdopterin-containing oxidoreductase family iron-sulfur binding subunit